MRIPAQRIRVMVAIKKGKSLEDVQLVGYHQRLHSFDNLFLRRKKFKFHRPLDGFGMCSIPEHTSIF